MPGPGLTRQCGPRAEGQGNQRESRSAGRTSDKGTVPSALRREAKMPVGPGNTSTRPKNRWGPLGTAGAVRGHQEQDVRPGGPGPCRGTAAWGGPPAPLLPGGSAPESATAGPEAARGGPACRVSPATKGHLSWAGPGHQVQTVQLRWPGGQKGMAGPVGWQWRAGTLGTGLGSEWKHRGQQARTVAESH